MAFDYMASMQILRIMEPAAQKEWLATSTSGGSITKWEACRGETLINMAICANDVAGIKTLTDILKTDGGDMEAPYVINALVYALRSKSKVSIETCHALVQLGASLRARDGYYDLVQLAIMNRRFKVLSWLLDNSASDYPIFAVGFNEMQMLIRHSHGDPPVWSDAAARRLVKSGADLNSINEYGYSLLAVATEAGNERAVKFFLLHGADPNAKNPKGRDALMIACGSHRSYRRSRDCYLKIIEVLIDAGAIPSTSALLEAISAKFPAAIRLLVKHGVPINATPGSDYWPLATAVKVNQGQLAIVKTLVKLGADVNYRRCSEHGRTSLLPLVGSIRMLDLLLDSGFRFESTDTKTGFIYRWFDESRLALRLLDSGVTLDSSERTSLLYDSIEAVDANLGARLLQEGGFDFTRAHIARQVRALGRFINALAHIDPALTDRIQSQDPKVRKMLARAKPKGVKLLEDAELASEQDLPECLRTSNQGSEKRLPARWCATHYFAPRLLDGRALPVQAIDNLGRMMRASTILKPHDGIAEVLTSCNRESLGKFAWSVLQNWPPHLIHGSETWVLMALSYFGDDACAPKLARLIRAQDWLFSYSIVGLDVLAAIGTNVALGEIQAIGLWNKHMPAKLHAQDLMKSIAKARRTTVKALEARCVPTLGFSRDGTLGIDFGGRRFIVRTDNKMRPRLFDESGQLLSKMPEPDQFDDLDEASAAADAWNSLLKELRLLARVQLLRFEDDMVTEGRLSGADFKQFVVSHPLLLPVACGLLWGRFRWGVLESTFRVLNDGSFADVLGKIVDIKDGAVVGVVHPLHLWGQVDKWRRVFKSEKIQQPFEQLARKAFNAEADHTGTLFGLQGSKVLTSEVKRLRWRGWVGWSSGSIGRLDTWDRSFGAASVRISTEPGIHWLEPGVDAPYQTLAIHDISDLTPVQFSELVRALVNLRA